MIEDELRALLQDRASTVAAGADPVPCIEAGVRRVVGRRRLAVAAGVPVLVGAIVAGAGLLSSQPRHDVTADAGPASPSASAVTIPTGNGEVPQPRLPAGHGQATSAAPPRTVPRPAPKTQVDVLRSYLETSAQLRAGGVEALPFSGRLYCALRVLDQSERYVYLWTSCQEFSLLTSGLSATSGSAGPVRLTIVGTGAGTRVVGFAAPHDGASERAELKALFSPLAVSRATTYADGHPTSGLDESDAQLKARAQADVRSGQLRAGLRTPAG